MFLLQYHLPLTNFLFQPFFSCADNFRADCFVSVFIISSLYLLLILFDKRQPNTAFYIYVLLGGFIEHLLFCTCVILLPLDLFPMASKLIRSFLGYVVQVCESIFPIHPCTIFDISLKRSQVFNLHSHLLQLEEKLN